MFRATRDRASLLVPALAALVLAACSHELDGAKPVISSPTNPHLVCNAQLITRVTITGTGFSPMPIDTALSNAHLQLPEVALSRTTDLAGMPAMGPMPITIADDPLMPAASHVHWTSQMEMSFDTPIAMGTATPVLAPGVYDLALTNPNGHATSFPSALAVVPPPMLTSVEPMAICDAQGDVMLMIHGTGFLNVGGTLPSVEFTGGGISKTYTPTSATGCTTLPAPATDAMTCTTMIVTIPMGDLPPGMYSVVVTNPPPANCMSTEAVSVLVVPPPHITNVMPARICTGGGTFTVNGMNFRMGAAVTVGTLAAGTVNVAADGDSAMATFGAGLDPGTYDLTLTNPEGCHDTLAGAIMVVDGPIVFWVDPNYVYNGITTQITIYASGLSSASAVTAVTITPSGGGAAIPLTFTMDARGRLQAIVPMGTPATDYTVTVDADGCSASLPGGLHITGTADLVLDRVDPSFGWTSQATSVDIYGAGFVTTPRVYLNPHAATAGTVATPLVAVGFDSATRLSALVPSGLPPGAYDVLVVNPDGHVGLLPSGFTVTMDAPPSIDTLSPQQVDAGGIRTINVVGNGFNTPTATWACSDGSMPAGTVMASTATTATVTLDTGALTAGTVCVLRLTNPDGSFGEFSAVAITTPAANIQMFRAGTDMNDPRRAPALVAGRVTTAARYLYAIGGDNGSVATAYDTSESTPVDRFGVLAASGWFRQPYHLPSALTLAGAQRIGKMIYVVGGDAGSGAVTNVWRAEILDPQLAPQVNDVSARRGHGAGLGAGIWTYRVSALFPMSDARNPGGESLPSDPLSVQLPTGLPDTLFLTIYFSDVAGASAYRIYRSPTAGSAPGTEVMIAEVPSAMPRSYEDMGAAVTSTQLALPLGAHGQWAAMPSLGTARSAAGLAQATDPADPTRHYLYAVGGRGGAALSSYEYLGITETDPRTHVVAAAWTAGAINLPTARSELGLFSVDHVAAPRLAAPRTMLYAANGLGGAGTVSDVDAAEVTPGGALCGTYNTGTSTCATPAWVSLGVGRNTAGYATAAGNNFLYTFGGGPTPGTSAVSAEICGAGLTCVGGPPDPPDIRNWNNEGISLNVARYLPGSSVESAFVFVVGGQSTGGPARSTEQTVL